MNRIYVLPSFLAVTIAVLLVLGFSIHVLLIIFMDGWHIAGWLLK